MFWLAIKMIPHTAMENAKQRAQEEPLRLSKNWLAAVVIFLLWDVTALGGIALCCRRFGNLYWQKHYWILLIAVGSVLLVGELMWVISQYLSEESTNNDDRTDVMQGINFDHTAGLLDGYAESS